MALPEGFVGLSPQARVVRRASSLRQFSKTRALALRLQLPAAPGRILYRPATTFLDGGVPWI